MINIENHKGFDIYYDEDNNKFKIMETGSEHKSLKAARNRIDELEKEDRRFPPNTYAYKVHHSGGKRLEKIELVILDENYGFVWANANKWTGREEKSRQKFKIMELVPVNEHAETVMKDVKEKEEALEVARAAYQEAAAGYERYEIEEFYKLLRKNE